MPDLTTYRAKRDPNRTPEPVPTTDGATSGDGNRFVIQEHHARALHWDFRLERDGVLVSWAVPKNLPVDPKTNHLAVHTEDHPLEYLAFEGDIPRGEYGGGGISVWDRGTYECEKWSDREVMVVLSGQRVSGRYVLFKTGSRDRDWMVHRMDPPPAGFTPMPVDLQPMLPTTTTRLPRDDAAWGYEFKWDGARTLVYVDGGRPRGVAGDADLTTRFPELRAMAAAIGAQRLVLDGVLVALDPDGRPSSQALRSRLDATDRSTVQRLATRTPASYLIVDVLYIDGRLLLEASYDDRRGVLDELGLSGDSWHTPPWFRGDGKAVREAARQQDLSGIVMKRIGSPYQAGVRSKDWRILEIPAP